MLLSEAIGEFIRYKVVRRGSTRDTEITYRSTMNGFLKCVGDIPVEQLTVFLIDMYADYIALQGYKPKTMHNKMATVRSFVRFLYSKDLSSIRPESVELPKSVSPEANFLSPDEQDKLLSVIKKPRDLAIVRVMIASGARVSELTNLKYDDFYVDSIVIQHGKGGKSRPTFLTTRASDSLQNYLKTKRRTEYLFTNSFSEKLSRQYVARIVSQYASDAGIGKKVTPHTLRHTFATNMLQNGARVEIVQPLMGHANIRTTLIYAHFTNNYLKEEYKKYASQG